MIRQSDQRDKSGFYSESLCVQTGSTVGTEVSTTTL